MVKATKESLGLKKIQYKQKRDNEQYAMIHTEFDRSS